MGPQENDEEDASRFDRVAEELRSFYLRSHRLLDRIMTGRGASFAKARLLLYIGREGTARSTDLAASFGYAPRTVTEAVDGLERDGLVQRLPDPVDRRVKRISLSPSGAAAALAAEQSKKVYLERVFSVLDPTEREEMVRLLKRLNDRLAALELEA